MRNLFGAVILAVALLGAFGVKATSFVHLPVVIQNYNSAIKWFTLAAEQGDAFAQINLGGMYQQGKGVPQDYKAALKWYIRAAEQGDAFGRYN